MIFLLTKAVDRLLQPTGSWLKAMLSSASNWKMQVLIIISKQADFTQCHSRDGWSFRFHLVSGWVEPAGQAVVGMRRSSDRPSCRRS